MTSPKGFIISIYMPDFAAFHACLLAEHTYSQMELHQIDRFIKASVFNFKFLS